MCIGEKKDGLLFSGERGIVFPVKFRYLWCLLFKSDGKRELVADRQISSATSVLQALRMSVVIKRE